MSIDLNSVGWTPNPIIPDLVSSSLSLWEALERRALRKKGEVTGDLLMVVHACQSETALKSSQWKSELEPRWICNDAREEAAIIINCTITRPTGGEGQTEQQVCNLIFTTYSVWKSCHLSFVLTKCSTKSCQEFQTLSKMFTMQVLYSDLLHGQMTRLAVTISPFELRDKPPKPKLSHPMNYTFYSRENKPLLPIASYWTKIYDKKKNKTQQFRSC